MKALAKVIAIGSFALSLAGMAPWQGNRARASAYRSAGNSEVLSSGQDGGTGSLWEDRAFVGSNRCASCHREQAEKQLASNMARAASRVEDHPLFEKFKNEAGRFLGYSLYFRWESRIVEYVVSDGQKQVRIPIQWAFGSGAHAVTFVARIEPGTYLESRISYYSKPGCLDFTPGRRRSQFSGLAEVAGHTTDRPEAFQCIFCHTTGTRNNPADGDIRFGELGVRCEACHGPGQLHVESVQKGTRAEARKKIENPGRYSAQRILDLCGTCHRKPPHDSAEVDWSDPATTRFQPIGLSQSLCYARSEGKLTCLSCHDAHINSRREDPQFYARICARCHYESRKPPAAICLSATPSDCVRCHMPRVPAFPHISFSNHWIGIYGDSSKLVPVRR